MSVNALQEVLGERDYVWEMEQQRFYTERENRLRELLEKQRELLHDAWRLECEQRDLERCTIRERQKLLNLSLQREEVALIEERPWQGSSARPRLSQPPTMPSAPIMSPPYMSSHSSRCSPTEQQLPITPYSILHEPPTTPEFPFQGHSSLYTEDVHVHA